jgi:hypothetical protein
MTACEQIQTQPVSRPRVSVIGTSDPLVAECGNRDGGLGSAEVSGGDVIREFCGSPFGGGLPATMAFQLTCFSPTRPSN